MMHSNVASAAFGLKLQQVIMILIARLDYM